MVETIALDKETFKALAGETRVEILKELNQRQKTQSELAAKLQVSAPTINEHLLLLKKAGLVQEIDDGHKWKYFSLTRKGKNLFNPSEAKVMLILSILSIAFFALLANVILKFSSVVNFSEKSSLPRITADNMAKSLVETAGQSKIANAPSVGSTVVGTANPGNITNAACGTISSLPWLEISLLVVIVAIIGVLFGYLLKKQ
jgi:DNA-binding transcriptional ArsR family regulator